MYFCILFPKELPLSFPLSQETGLGENSFHPSRHQRLSGRSEAVYSCQRAQWNCFPRLSIEPKFLTVFIGSLAPCLDRYSIGGFNCSLLDLGSLLRHWSTWPETTIMGTWNLGYRKQRLGHLPSPDRISGDSCFTRWLQAAIFQSCFKGLVFPLLWLWLRPYFLFPPVNKPHVHTNWIRPWSWEGGG